MQPLLYKTLKKKNKKKKQEQRLKYNFEKGRRSLETGNEENAINAIGNLTYEEAMKERIGGPTKFHSTFL